MAMADNLLNALKAILHQKGITYKDAAQALDLSEVSIKRLFSEKNCSLMRLEKLCELADTDFTELNKIAETQHQQLTELSFQQEKMLVSETHFLLVAVCIINRWTFDQIISKYQFTMVKLTGIFTQLDQIGFIDLLPGNRYRLRISRRFNWLPNGPIQKFFLDSILEPYMQSDIHNSGNHLRFEWGMLAKESVDELNQKIHRLLDEYRHISEQDARIPVENKLTSSLLIMFREDWEPESFKQLWR